MKFKLTVLLAAVVVAMGLLLGASTTQAATVICQNEPEPCADGESVIRIEDLEVLDITGNITVYNMDFVDDTAINVYGSGLDFDFPIAANALAALEAVTDALNAEDPTPLGAGPQGSNQFFIGNLERLGRVLGLGGQNISGVWDQCETDCVLGVTLLTPTGFFTYADFTEVP